MKYMYENIVVGVDGSEQADKAFHKAVQIQKHIGNPDGGLYIVSAVHLNTDIDVMYATVDAGVLPFVRENDDLSQQALQSRKELVDDYEQKARDAGIEHIYVTVNFGDPKEMIVDLPEPNVATLIVLAATTKKRLERFVIGSVAQHTVNNAPCDVLIIK